MQIIPTGVGSEFGGFAGAGCPVTNLLAASVDYLVTHPNAVNASDPNEMAGNVLYVEGKSLDNFLLGHLGLVEVNAICTGSNFLLRTAQRRSVAFLRKAHGGPVRL